MAVIIMCTIAELDRCPFMDLCEMCHPEDEMVEKRKTCSDENCQFCGVFWAFQDGLCGIDED